MDKNELPSSVPLANVLLFRDDVPPVVLRTFARLYALAWKHHYDRTDRFTTDELLVILDLGMRQMYEHISKLRKLGVLEWASDGGYGYIFTFPKSGGVPVPDEAPYNAEVTAWIAGPTAEIRSQDSASQNSTAEIRSPAAEIRSPAAEIRSQDLANQNSTAEKRSPAAEIRSQDSANQNSTAEIRTSTAEIRSPAAEIRSWEAPSSVVVVVNNTPDLNLEKQQQQQGERLGVPAAEKRSPAAEIRSWPELVEVLTTAGMWNDLAEGLTAGLDVNGVLDALGWVAAVRADRRVHNHGAVLVKHLEAGRHAPVDWRPAAVCAACGVVDYRCTCGASERMVPAVYYTAAIEPVEEWGRDRWGVCQTCGRVACDGHNQAADDAAESEATYAASPNGAAVDLREAQIRQAWEDVEQLMRVRYATSVDLVGVVGNQAQITFAGKDRHQTMKLVQANFYRRLQRDVEVVDAGPT